jgi:exonuclease-1
MDPDGFGNFLIPIQLISCLGIEIDLGNLRKIKKPNFTEFTQEMLLVTCIFSGCDYLDSIKGIGFVRAQKLVEQAGEDDTVSTLF